MGLPPRHDARRLPRWHEVRPLLRLRRPARLNRVTQLENARTVDDLRRLARRRVPRPVFDYVDGGAESELTMQRALAAFQRVEFRPRVLRDVSSVDTSTTILGDRTRLPVIFAPTGFSRLLHHRGEVAVARIAQEAGLPYILSTMGTTSIESVAVAAPGATRWFQLYIWRDRSRTEDLVARARDAGYTSLVVTVDVPVSGSRLRDARNGFTIPPAPSIRALADIARRPAWWINLLTTEPLSFATLDDGSPSSLADLINTMFDPTVSVADLHWLRGRWAGPLIVKGVQTAHDARMVIDAGANAVVVSNHGGRQLDRSLVTLEALPAIAAEVGDDAEVYLDGGVRSGADVVAAVGLGARACLIGRAYLYGLMAGGEAGVRRVVDILAADICRTLQLLGAPSLSEVDGTRVTLRLP